jgi:thiol-disulfide isomerase/thioredoxin
MKRFIPIIITALTISACTLEKPKTSVLSGQFLNFTSSFALLTSEGITDSIFVNEDGSFSTQIELTNPSYFNLRGGRVGATLFVLPGEDLSIVVDINAPAEIPEFSGSTADINRYIYKANNITRGLTSNMRELYSYPRDIFMGKLDSVKADIFNLLEELPNHNKQFVELEKARIGYRFMSLMYDYPMYNARLLEYDFVENDEDYAFLETVNFNNQKHLHINEFANLLYKHFQKVYQGISVDETNKGKSEFEKMIIYFEKVDSLISDSKIRDFIKHSSIIETIQWGNLEVSKNVVEHFLSRAKTESYRILVEQAFSKRMLLAPGEPAPEFTHTGIDGNTYSLTDFRGKLVYIDFWASWCGPCRAEIPHLKTLKEAYSSKPVVFVAISLDDDKSAWERMVKDQELKGYQLHAEKAWLSESAKKYQVNGVPTFVLIDGEGKIIEYNAPRPSNPEISLLLDKHIKLMN